MMTGRFPVVYQQPSVEREAVFLAGDDPNPETNPNIIIGEDAATAEKNNANLDYKEVLEVVTNVGKETAFSVHFIDTEEQRAAVANSYARSVDYISEGLTDSQRLNVADRAIDALQGISSDETVQKLIDVNRNIAQTARAQQKEVLAAREEKLRINAELLSIRTQIAIQANEAVDGSEAHQQLLVIGEKINAIIEQTRVTPAVSEQSIPVDTPAMADLEAQYNAPATPESQSPGRGIQLGKLAKTVIHSTVELAHKVKDSILLDESELDTDTKVLEIVK